MAGFPVRRDDDLPLGRDEPSDALYEALIAGLIACVALLALLCVLRMIGIL